LPNLTYYDNLQKISGTQVVGSARKVIQDKKTATQQQTVAQIAGPTGSRSIYQIWVNAQKVPSQPGSPQGQKEAAPLAEKPSAPMPAGAPGTAPLDFME